MPSRKGRHFIFIGNTKDNNWIKHLLGVGAIAIILFSIFLAIAFKTNAITTYKTTTTIEPKVYITNTGDKYHSSNCNYLSRSKIAIGLYEAQESGYHACAICNGHSTDTITVIHKEANGKKLAVLDILIVIFGSLILSPLVYVIIYQITQSSRQQSSKKN